MEAVDFAGLASKLRKECQGKVIKHYPLNKITSFGIGGQSEVFLHAEDVDDLRIALELCSKSDTPYYIIGKGSNILVSDEGFKGLTIKLGLEFKNIKVEGNRIICGAAIGIAKLVKTALRYNLKGLNFLAGIPATVGGAIAVNAGAFGSSICQKAVHIRVFSRAGLKSYEVDDIKISSYRKSFLPPGEIVLEAVFALEKGKRDELKVELTDFLAKRRASQPQKYPNAGSIFKNPSKIKAGKLIEDAGWKGKGVGDAFISNKHANFIINKGRAKATDVYGLIKLIQSDIYYKSGIMLEPEVKFIGFFEDEKKEHQRHV